MIFKLLLIKKTIKYLATVLYKPLLTKYLSKTRSYLYKDIRLVIPPEVFHPGFFFSTKLFIRYISELKFEGKTFLELGAGSGLISIYTAKRNAIVTATDINPIAIEYLEKNSKSNHVALHIILSDMFKQLPKQQFDIIVINPPFYKRNPQTLRDYAWYCGENGEYFQSLFSDLSDYMDIDSMVLMILSEDCDLEMIRSIASKNRFNLNCVFSKKNIMEQNFIYRIAPFSNVNH